LIVEALLLGGQGLDKGPRIAEVANVQVRRIAGGLGIPLTMASTIGKALAPTLPRYFTDNILTKRTGIKFEWDTADSQAVLKARNVAIGATLQPSFVQLIQAWQKRGGIIETPAAAS
jgi:hypothetical protein